MEGMTCARCVSKVRGAVLAIPGSLAADLDLSTRELVVTSENSDPRSEVISAVQAAGFKAQSLKHRNSQGTLAGDLPAHRLRLAQLGVAGACAGNIMIFSFAGYLSEDLGSFEPLFGYLSGLFFLPVFLFSAQPFFQNTWTSLKAKKASVDIPITLAILGGGLVSYAHLAMGKFEDVYFDSLAMFLFFLLSSRYLIARLQMGVLKPIEVSDLMPGEKVKKREGDGSSVSVRPESLVRGDEFQLEAGQHVPVDSELTCDWAYISDAIFSGESDPKVVKKYERVSSGSVVASSSVTLRALSDPQSSRLQSLVNRLNTELLKPTQLTSLVDRGSQALTYLILASVLGVLVWFGTSDLYQGVSRSLALLVVACPCALAIATPLAYALTLRRGFRFGVLIKSPESLERLCFVRQVVFDKTGTLTRSIVELGEFDPPLSPEDLDAVFALESRSEHPLARAICRKLSQQVSISEPQPITEFNETPGVGVEARCAGHLYEIKKVAHPAARGDIGIFKNKQLISQVAAADSLQVGARALMGWLTSRSYQVFLLSGDTEAKAKQTASALNLKPENVLAEMMPEEKMAWVQRAQKEGDVCFVGDGVNDAMSLKAAAVGVSVHSSAEVTYLASDVHILGDNILALRKLIALSSLCRQAIVTNLSLSFVYNISFGILAVLGLMNPLVAVIIMPLSSVSLVLLTTWKLKGDIE